MEADRGFMLIAVTPAEPVADEGEKIAAILDAGWSRVHLRHPAASRTEMRDIIESVPLRLHRHLVLHGHFDLSFDYNLGGLHLNRRCPSPPANYSGPLSKSCHSMEEVTDSAGCRYVTLSPIFDSISKVGYHGAFSTADLYKLEGITKPMVIALGGVTRERISCLRKFNFAGAAMLGDIPWHSSATEISLHCKRTIESC